MQILDLDCRVGHLAAQVIPWAVPALTTGRVQAGSYILCEDRAARAGCQGSHELQRVDLA